MSNTHGHGTNNNSFYVIAILIIALIFAVFKVLNPPKGEVVLSKTGVGGVYNFNGDKVKFGENFSLYLTRNGFTTITVKNGKTGEVRMFNKNGNQIKPCGSITEKGEITGNCTGLTGAQALTSYTTRTWISKVNPVCELEDFWGTLVEVHADTGAYPCHNGSPHY